MNVIGKIDFLIKQLNISEKEFAKEFKIKQSLIKKWRNGSSYPKPQNIAYLCERFNFAVGDFLDTNSSIDVDGIYADEHVINGKINVQGEHQNNEDFPPESNPRYEEKD